MNRLPRVEEPEPASLPATGGRLRLKVAYDGRPFAGWQSQANGESVQEHLEKSLSSLCGVERIVVHGSGRTDAGVHARGQVAHADVPDPARFTLDRWALAINAHLPAEIRVVAVRLAPPDFHARFSASGKVYRYRLWNSPVFHPFEIGRAWHVPGPLDDDAFAAAARLLVGRHDFAAFAANRGKPGENTVRTIRRVDVRRRGSHLTLEYEGNGFLYKMVRLLTGSLIRCAQGRAESGWISRLLAGEAGKTSFMAPAEGLYLWRVLYGKDQREPL